MQRTQHRPDIDGLRAIAVLAVILFHAGVGGFTGGFVGVDVFFVISGFLITSILLADLDAGTFSFVRFYERRARRLLPALLAMLVIVVAASAMLLPTARFAQVVSDAFHAAFFTANISFWQQAGYFEAESATSPLLHTWSLSVEEQFYLVVPVVLFLLRRTSRRRLFIVLATMSLASFVLTEWAWRFAPDAGFFLPFTRAWELLAGSLAAMLARRRGVRPNNGLSLFGIILIAVPIILLDESSPFPSHLTLAPVGGTMLLVLFGTDRTIVGRLLATRPMVTVGSISYSAYLWHQPLLSFVRIRTAQERLPPSLTIAAITATLVVGYVSWRWIEQPFRHGRVASSGPRRVLIAAGVALVLFGGSAQVLATTIDRATHSDGVVTTSIDITRIDGSEAADELELTDVIGTVTVKRPTTSGSACTVLAFGDSHTGHLVTGFAERFIESTGCGIHLWTFVGCPSLLGHYKIYDLDERSLPEREIECRSVVRAWDDHVRQTGDRYDAVIMSSRWNWLIGESEYGDSTTIRRDAVVEMSVDRSTVGELTDAERLTNLATALNDTVTHLRRQIPTVIVLSQPPVQQFDLRNLEIGPAYAAAAPDQALAGERHDRWTTAVDRSGIEAIDGTVHVDLFDELYCPEPTGRCRNLIDDRPLYRDVNHLSTFGSELTAEVVLRRLDELGVVLGS